MLRFVLVYAIEAATIVLSAIIAFSLRFDFSIPSRWFPVLGIGLAVWIPVKLVSFRLFELDRRWARYVSLPDLTRLVTSNAVASAFGTVLLVAIRSGVPRTIYAIDLLLCICITAGVRVSVRVAAELTRPKSSGDVRKRALIYGAGDAGAALLRDLRHHPSMRYDVVGFIDDDKRKTGLVLHGARVLGGCGELAAIVPKVRVELVLIAIPSATGARMKQILEHCNTAGVPYKTIPSLAEIVDDAGLARQIRDVAVEDLLGRTPVNLEQDRISARLHGQTILVTGAAGSIGSEICRQVARFQPAAIIGFEIAESPLFNLALELGRDFPDVVFHPEIGSIQNSGVLEAFERHRPDVVYHAAAYKHVPLMESHVFEAVENNVFGTLNVVQTARDFGVLEFVMISSDKAVRPSSIMGATKRLAELIVRSLQPEGARYVSVRFGNATRQQRQRRADLQRTDFPRRTGYSD